MNTAAVLKFFQLKEDGKYLCLLPSCPRGIQPLAAAKTNKNSNLRRHLKQCHAEQYHKFELENGTTDQVIRKLKMVQYIVEAVTVNGRPLSFLEDSGIKGLIEMLADSSDTAPKFTVTLTTIRQNIEVKAQRIREKITNELKGRIISVSADIATKGDRGLLGISVHYYSEGRTVSRTIGMIEIDERHTGETIKTMILANLMRYDVSFDRVYAFAAIIAISIIEKAKFINVETIGGVASSHNNEAYNVDSWIDLSRNLRVAIRHENAAIQLLHVAEFKHAIQAAVRDGLAASDRRVFIANCREIAKILRSQEYLLEFRNRGAELPLMDDDTRWDSTYLMLKRLLEIKEIIAGPAETDMDLFLSESEWKQLKKIVNVLRHPYQVTMLLQRVNLTQSDFYAAWLELKLVLQGIHENDVDETLAQSILNAMDSAKHDHVIRNASMQCSVFLDPRLKNELLRDSERSCLARMSLSKLHERFFQTKSNGTSSEWNERNDSGDGIAVYSNLTRYMKALDCSISPEKTINAIKTTKTDISQLLDDFANTRTIGMEVSVLEYWEQNKNTFPGVYELAKIVYSVPTNETAIENTFSALMFAFFELQGNLADPLLENIMLIKLNQNLFYEVVSDELQEALTR